uniref:N-acetyl-transferase n=1 Tax=Hirsutella thompsonii TaxID=42368 RepID=A0A3G2ZPA8_HIRTH|nr:N-acetyl-transferase [Hirsutella thompsonii]
MANTPHNTILVSTTLPKKGNHIPPFTTDRLIVRPFVSSDFETFYSMAVESYEESPNIDKNSVQAAMNEFVSETSMNYGIFLKNSDGSEGELIGDGGMWDIASKHTGWPEFGYRLSKLHRGKGYATEFAKAYVQSWWRLERTNVHIHLVPCFPHLTEHQGQLPEQLFSTTSKENKASQRVLEKVGFERFDDDEDEDVYWLLEIISWFFFLFLACYFFWFFLP